MLAIGHWEGLVSTRYDLRSTRREWLANSARPLEFRVASSSHRAVWTQDCLLHDTQNCLSLRISRVTQWTHPMSPVPSAGPDPHRRENNREVCFCGMWCVCVYETARDLDKSSSDFCICTPVLEASGLPWMGRQPPLQDKAVGLALGAGGF